MASLSRLLIQAAFRLLNKTLPTVLGKAAPRNSEFGGLTPSNLKSYLNSMKASMTLISLTAKNRPGLITIKNPKRNGNLPSVFTMAKSNEFRAGIGCINLRCLAFLFHPAKSEAIEFIWTGINIWILVNSSLRRG